MKPCSLESFPIYMSDVFIGLKPALIADCFIFILISKYCALSWQIPAYLYNMTKRVNKNAEEPSIWTWADIDKAQFYAVAYHMETVRREQLPHGNSQNYLSETSETVNGLQTSDDAALNLFLDRLALLFTRFKSKSFKKTPQNVTATGLWRQGDCWTVYITKNDGRRMDETEFTASLQQWFNFANSEDIEPGSKNDLWVGVIKFWEQRINYYIDGLKYVWEEKLNDTEGAEERLRNLFSLKSENIDLSIFAEDWFQIRSFISHIQSRTRNGIHDFAVFEQAYRFWTRERRQPYPGWKELQAKEGNDIVKESIEDVKDFRKCIHYLEMLGMPKSIWNSLVFFRKFKGGFEVKVESRPKPCAPAGDLKLDKSSILKVLGSWREENPGVKKPYDNLENTGRPPNLYFHCELQMLRLLQAIEHGAHPFIGCSKLSCELCWCVLEGAKAQGIPFKTRGSHHKLSANCSFLFPPEGYKFVSEALKEAQERWSSSLQKPPGQPMTIYTPIDDTQPIHTNEIFNLEQIDRKVCRVLLTGSKAKNTLSVQCSGC